MKANIISKRLMAMLAIVIMGIASAKAQGEKLEEFQNVVTEYQNRYQSAAWNGIHKDAIEPLKTLINLFDTTTVFIGTQIPKGAIIEQKGMYLYDLACCYALTGQKKLALEALTKSVECGYKQYNNKLNDKDLVSLHKDKKYQALLAQVKERSPPQCAEEVGAIRQGRYRDGIHLSAHGVDEPAHGARILQARLHCRRWR